MRFIGRAGCAVLVFVFALLGANDVCAQTLPSAGVVTESAPVFLYPDARRTPLTTLPSGTPVRVLARDGEWYRIEFLDRRLGNRTGYIAANAIRLQAPAIPPGQPPTAPVPPGPTRKPAAGAQRRPARGRTPATPPASISLNGGVQATSRSFSSASTFVEFVESGSLESNYDGNRPIVFDVAATIGVWRALGAGVAVTYASKALDGQVTAEIPHPFFFDRPRTVTGVASDLAREELAVHLDAAWTVQASPSMQVAVFAGPSFFRVTQGLVTDVTVTDIFPFDEPVFATATTSEATQSKWGFNVGFDVTQRLSRYVGVGVMGRYSRALFKFPVVTDQNAEIEAGGFQLGGGIRLQF